jgi:hypothetical protein
VIYDENNWAPAALRQEFQGHSVILEPSTTSPNSLTVSGKRFGTLVLLVVPHDADQATAITAVTLAADPGNVSSAEDLLQIAKSARRQRRGAPMTQPRCGSDGEVVPRRGHIRSEPAIAIKVREVRHAQ